MLLLLLLLTQLPVAVFVDPILLLHSLHSIVVGMDAALLDDKFGFDKRTPYRNVPNVMYPDSGIALYIACFKM